MAGKSKKSFKKLAEAIVAAISEAVNQTLASKLTRKYGPNRPSKAKVKVATTKRKAKATRKAKAAGMPKAAGKPKATRKS
jgi:hypothetical protein